MLKCNHNGRRILPTSITYQKQSCCAAAQRGRMTLLDNTEAAWVPVVERPKASEKRRWRQRALVGVAVAATVATSVASEREAANVVTVNAESIDAFSSKLDKILANDDALEKISHADPADITVTNEQDSTLGEYVVDSEYGQVYKSTPKYAAGLEYVDPGLLNAANIDTIRVQEVEGLPGATDSTKALFVYSTPNVLYLDDDFINSPETDRFEVGSAIRHEAMHALHFHEKPPLTFSNLPRYPAFAAANPGGFHYQNEQTITANDDYDEIAKGAEVSVGGYATKSQTEDIAEIGAVMTMPSTTQRDRKSELYIDKLRDNDGIIKAKTAAMLALMDDVEPGYGDRVLANIASNLQRK